MSPIYLGGSVVSFEDLDRAIEELFYKSDEGLFQCRECEHVSKQKPNIVNRVEEGLIKFTWRASIYF